MFIVTHRNIFFALMGIILAAAIGAISVFGLPLSIEFTGGSLIEVSYEGERPALPELEEALGAVDIGPASLRAAGEQGVIVRSATLSPEQHDAALAALSQGGAAPLTELRFNSIGPSLGNELATKALYAIGAVILAIVLYIAWAFRRVSRPVSSWLYGASVIIILVHDILIPTGFYAAFAYFTGAQVDSLFVVALLAILGYSVNDTIVIFDRVREHLRRNEDANVEEAFDAVVGKSIVSTLGRSINTSLTTALALLALVILGSPVTLNFALVLLVGVLAGTYSSILIAAPLLVTLAKAFPRKEKPVA